MLKRPSEQRLTLEERVAVVIAIAVAVGVHLVIFLGGSGIGYLAREEKKRERLMVIRQVREVTPAPEIAVRVPDPRRVQVSPEPEGASGGSAPKPERQMSARGTPPPKSEITPKMEEDLQEALRKEQEQQQEQGQENAQPAEEKGARIGDASVSVVTDLAAASFTLSGPVEYRGTGTFWIRRGAPAGTYRIAFSPVAGFSLPPPQTKELVEKGQVVFIGKYKRSTELAVESNTPGAQVTIYRPDGRPLDVNRPGRALIDDLPPGDYTAVFSDVPGHITPGPQTRTLASGGKLAFVGEYRDAPPGSGDASGEQSSASEARGGSYGSGRGSGRGTGSGTGSGNGTGSGGSGSGRGGRSSGQVAEVDSGLDRRVKIVVTSYPPTSIERHYDEIPYPEVIIRKGHFQQGICQVYLILNINARGDIEKISVERPAPELRSQYETLTGAVESAVRSWDYDKVKAEVHVDVRFYVE